MTKYRILTANRAGYLLCCCFVPYTTATKVDGAWVLVCTASWSSAVRSLLLATLAKQIVIVFKGKRSVTNAAFVLLQNTDLTVKSCL